jgi:transposase-like protein
MKIQCPQCRSDAIYRYGRTAGGKKRFICLICERQFVANPKKCSFHQYAPLSKMQKTNA